MLNCVFFRPQTKSSTAKKQLSQKGRKSRKQDSSAEEDDDDDEEDDDDDDDDEDEDDEEDEEDEDDEEDEVQDSATEIETDSEFDQNSNVDVRLLGPQDIPTIIVNESELVSTTNGFGRRSVELLSNGNGEPTHQQPAVDGTAPFAI